MKIKKMEKEELFSVYETYGPMYFPSEELKPLSAIERLWENGIYLAYGLYDNKNLIAYACFVKIEGHKYSLLDYYAVLEAYRNSGLGGQFLGLLQKELEVLNGIYIESEEPECALDQREREVRTKRISFYERNGAKKIGLGSCLFGVNYQILFLPCRKKETEDYYKELNHIYRTMFSNKHYETQVKLYNA